MYDASVYLALCAFVFTITGHGNDARPCFFCVHGESDALILQERKHSCAGIPIKRVYRIQRKMERSSW